MSLSEVLQLVQTLMPILVPAAIALLGLLVKHSPFLRNPQLQKLALVAVQQAEQQGKSGWTSEDKYNAAASALTLLASKAGYKVDADEAKSLIESSVLVLQPFLQQLQQGAGIPSDAQEGEAPTVPANPGTTAAA